MLNCRVNLLGSRSIRQENQSTINHYSITAFIVTMALAYDDIPGTACSNSNCRHPSSGIRPRYKCQVALCRRYVHPYALGCSLAVGSDGQVECLPNQGCKANAPAKAAPPPPAVDFPDYSYLDTPPEKEVIPVEELDLKPKAKGSTVNCVNCINAFTVNSKKLYYYYSLRRGHGRQSSQHRHLCLSISTIPVKVRTNINGK